MSSIKAIFIKQAKDMSKNPMVLNMFIIFPAVALVMTVFVPIPPNDFVHGNMFVTMMAAIFAGMGLITTASDVIAEDIERRSLRFLIIAGVKPHQYLLGTGGFFLLAGAVTSVIFSLIGGFTGAEFLKFMTIMIAGTATSILLGTVIGMVSKNRQAATSLCMPIAVIVGFTPMIANFNETVEKVAGVLYTQQINLIVNDFSASLWQPLLVIASNIVVLTVSFVIAYKKKGLKR
jgi:ABC-2 type transport system permease protein